jgi:hypothetical protein
VSAESLARLGHNESVFRQVNERIEAGRWRGEEDEPIAFRCECSALGCNLLIELTRGEYEQIRAFPRRFLLAPGHELPETEVVLERHPTYLVVEKHGVAGRVAERTDPRED